MKKKILFIALNYPPSGVISSIRAYNLTRMLSDFDFNVTVLTVSDEYLNKTNKDVLYNLRGIKIIRVKYFVRLEGGNLIGNSFIPRILRRLLLKILQLFGLDYLSFWQRIAIQEVIKTKDKYDYIIATGPPFSNFNLARKLSARLNSKFIVDYRDLWSLSPHNKEKNNFFHSRKEKKILKKASLSVFVSNSMGKVMNKYFEIQNSYILTNGFNKSMFENVPLVNFDKFTISYTGNFYFPKRIIDPLFKSFKFLKENERDVFDSINFIYCGRDGDYIEKKAKEYNIISIVENRFQVSSMEAFSITKNSHLSVVITSVIKEGDLSDKSIITGKLFEAFGMNTKVLCISPLESDIRKIINSNNRGYNFTGEEIIEISRIIKQERKKRFEKKIFIDNSDFEWTNLIKKFVRIINEVKI